MASFPHQYLYLSGGIDAAPKEIINGSRLAANLNRASVCSIFDSVLDSMGCSGYAYAPVQPDAMSDAALWLDAADGSPSRQVVPNRGTGGANLNGTLGAGTAVGTDEPLWLGGGENYLYVPGVAGNTATLPNTASLQLAGDIDLMARVSLDDWTPAAGVSIISKYVAGAQGYELAVSAPSGQVTLVYRSAIANVSTASPSAVPATDGAAVWIRAARVAATGVISFYWAPDSASIPTAWASLGTGSTTAGAIVTGTQVMTLGNGGFNPMAGKIFRTIVRGAIDASTPQNLLDVDFTQNANQTSFVASAGGTVTINRAATGRKSVMYLGRPLWLFGTDDFIQVADNNVLDFALNESLTVLVVQRAHNMATGTVNVLVSKTPIAVTAGYLMYNSVDATSVFLVNDGAAVPAAASPNKTASALTVSVGRRDVTADTVTAWTNGTSGAGANDTTTATSANANVLRVGASTNGNSFYDGEIMAVLIWRRALTDAEIAQVSAFFTAPTFLTSRCWSAIDTTAISKSPWYDSRDAASGEALGFFVEEWTGLDGEHYSRSSVPTGINRGGSYFGPQSQNQRVWKMNVLLHGTSERGLNYLFRWLESTLANCCGAQCDEQFAWLRQVCPTDPANDPEEGVVRAERVVMLQGPTWESTPIETFGCYLRRVSFTLGAGDPCLYREARAVTYNESTTSGTGTGNLLTQCGTFNGDNRRTIAAMTGPEGFGQRAPVVTVASPAQASGGVVSSLPSLRIAGYLDPNGTGDPCRSVLIGEFILEGVLAAGYEIVVDMAKRMIRKRPAGTATWLDGSNLMAAAVRSGLRRWWAFSACDSGLVVVEPTYTRLEAFKNYTAAYPIVTSWTVNIQRTSRLGCC